MSDKPESESRFKVYQVAEFIEKYEEQHRKARAGCRIAYDDDPPSIDLTWGGYTYWIALDRLNTTLKVCGWIAHLAEKEWMNAERMGIFVEKVAIANNWPANWRDI